MKINKEIIAAIEAAIQSFSDYGIKGLASKIGVNPNAITRWRNPEKYQKTITDENWQKLYPAIKPYLPTDFNSKKPDKEFSQSQSSQRVQPEEIVLRTFTPGQQIITGVINVYGVPNEKIIEALKTTDLTESQKDELRRKIFS